MLVDSTREKTLQNFTVDCPIIQDFRRIKRHVNSQPGEGSCDGRLGTCRFPECNYCIRSRFIELSGGFAFVTIQYDEAGLYFFNSLGIS